MKRWLSMVLSLMMILSTVLGDISLAVAEDTEEVISANVEAEVSLSDEAGVSGLVIEPEDAEIPAVTEDVTDNSAEDIVPEEDIDTAEESEDIGNADAENNDSGKKQEASEAVFEFGYAKVISDSVKVFAEADTSSKALAVIGKGAVVLCTEHRGEGFKAVFNTSKGIVAGWISENDIKPMNTDEINDFMDATTRYDAVVLYNDDLDLPLANVDCEFPEEPSEAPAEDAVVEGEADMPTVEDEVHDEVAEVPAEETVVEGEADMPVVEDEVQEEAAEVPAEETVVEDEADMPVVEDEVQEDAVEDAVAEEDSIQETIPELPLMMSVYASGEKSAETVSAKETISFSQPEVNLSVKMKTVLEAAVFDSEGQKMDAELIYTYIPADPAMPVISLNGETGEVTAKNPGNAVVTVTAKNGFGLICGEDGNPLQAECEVIVAAAPAKVKLSVTKVTIGYKEKYQLVAKGYDANDNEVPAAFTYKTKDKSYVTIDEEGTVYGKKYGKSIYVYAYAQNGEYARCKVTVKKAPSSVSVKPASLILSSGGMTAALKPAVNSSAACTAYTYSGYDSNVISVSADGVVTTKNAGSTNITVSVYNGKSVVCPVSVLNPPSEVYFNENTLTIGVEQTGMVSAFNRNQDGFEAPTTYTYALAAGDEQYVSLNTATGEIKGLAKGTATVYVSAHNGVNTGKANGETVTAACMVKVVDAPIGIQLTATKRNVGYKEKYYDIMDYVRLVMPDGSLITPEEAEEKGLYATTFSFKSSKKSYVSVNAETGMITGKKTDKSAYIYVTTHNGHSAKIKVTVKKAPSKVTVSPTKLNLGANGMQYKLTAKVNSGAYSSGFTYSTSDPKVVTVDEKTGLLTSVGAGTATITVKSFNGKKATCKVTVGKEPAEIQLSAYEFTIGAGSTRTLTVSAKDDAGAKTYGSYTYTVEQASDVISIDDAGNITALNKGEAVITVKAHNGVTGGASADGTWLEAKCRVRVLAAPTAIKASATGITIGYKETYYGIPGMITMVAPEGETECLTDISYKSSRTSYVKVDSETGAVYGKKAGYSYITVKPGNGLPSVKIKVTVKNAPSKSYLSATQLTLSEGGQTYRLKASVNSSASCSTYTWKSSDTSVATVSDTGLVTTVGTGTATITVTPYKGKSATCTVNVIEAPTQVFLPESIVVAKGQKAGITASVSGKNGTESTANFTYQTSDSRITVNASTGEIKGVSVTGSEPAYITVRTHNGVSTHFDENGIVTETVCKVTVIDAPSKVVLNTSSETIGVGQTFKLEPTMYTSDGKAMNGGTFTYKVEGSGVSVDADGNVKGTKAGTAYVYAASADGAVSPACTVVVKKAPTSVSLSPSSATMGVGQTKKFTVKLSSGSAGSYTLTSSNTDVAFIENDGTVTAVGAGTATITVKTFNGKKDTSKLTVKEGPEFLAFNTDYIEVFDESTGNYKLYYFKHMLPGTTFKLTYKPEAYTVGEAIAYISENPGIASVAQDGTLTAVSEGCTAIVVQSSSGVLEMCFVVVEGASTPFEFLDSDRQLTLAMGETVPMPDVTNSNAMYDMFIDYTVEGDVAEIVFDESGNYMLKAVKAGSCTLRACSVTGKNTSMTITVADAPANISIDMPDVVLIGESAKVNVGFEGIGSYTLSVSDETLAEITEEGYINALAVGEVTVTALMQNGVSASKTVLLRNKPDRVELSEASARLNVGETFQIEPVIDVNSYTEYAFASDNTAVAEVNATGVVTAKAPGSARITVRTSVPGVFAAFDVTVNSVQTLTVEPSELRLKNGGEGGSFTAAVPEGDAITEVICSNDALTEGITFSGNVISVGKPLCAGEAVVAVKTAGGLEAVCRIIVSDTAEAIQANPAALVMGVGEKADIAISFVPETAWANVTAKSSNENTATVDASGKITAVAPGDAVISYTAEGLASADVSVKVVNAPEIIRMSVESADVIAGSSFKLDAPELLSTAGISGGSYTWAVEDAAIASVSDDGVVTGLKAGKTSVKVRAYNGVSAYVAVTVWEKAEKIAFADESISMAVNETYLPKVISESGAVVGAVLTSANADIVRVDENGALVAVSAGKTEIIATFGELTAKTTVEVMEASSKVTLNASEISLGVKESFALTVSLDSGAASAGTKITSDDPTVASVDKNGVVKALRPGTAVITAEAFGGAFASCKVTVMAAPTGIAFDVEEVDGNMLEKGMQLTWHFDSEAQGGSIRFESEDESIATVDENGYVTFKKLGWTTIGVITYNGHTDTVDLTVHRVPETAVFTYPEIIIQKGDSVVNPIVMSKNSYANFKVASSDESIVKADAYGNFSALKSGNATVTLSTDWGLTAKCTVKVVDKLEGMKLSKTSLGLALGEETTLSVSFGDKNAVANVRYASSNPSIATVDELTGKVKAVKKGSCTIYAHTIDGTNSASCKVTVNGPRYRMFLGYEYYGSEFKSKLYFPKNNVNSMKATFANSSINGVSYDFNVMANPSKNSLLSGIASYFADSTDSDVNFIYLCSHGHDDINGTKVNGYSQYGFSLQGYNTSYDLGSPYYYVTATELYACLSQIKGKVVLILDSCNSGQFILNMQPRLDKEKNNRISVLTAVQGGVNASYYNVTSTSKAVDFFTYYLMYGLGYDEQKDKHDYVLRADSNGNGKVTLKEFFNYGKTATSSYVSKSSTYKAKWFKGDKKQVPQSYIKGDMADLIVYDPK